MSDTWIIVTILFFVALCALALLLLIAIYIREYWKFMDLPHEEPKRLLQVFQELTGAVESVDELELYQQIYQRFKGSGPFCGFYWHLQPRVLVLERDLLRQILINDFSNFNDHGVYNNIKHDALSADLYSRHGGGWREMRLRLEPYFMHEQMRQLHAGLYEDSHQLLQTIETAIKEASPDKEEHASIEMQLHMRRYVLRSIAKCVFGLDAVQQHKYPLSEFDDMTQLALTTHRHGECLTTTLQNHPTLGRYLRCVDTNTKVANYFLALIEDVVSEREHESSTESRQDFLQLLIDIKTQELNTHESDDKEGEPKYLKQHLIGELAAHAFSFLKSGLEPTASTLAYVLYELAENQAEQQKVRQELQEALARHGNELSYECVQELQYMWQIILETIRLHPFKPYLIRRTLNDYRVHSQPKYFIRKNMYVIIPTDAMHHDPANYPEPYIFKPERFSPENSRTRELCMWLGFGEGSRNCIGQHFAKLQMRIALARLLLQYKFTLDMRKVVIKCRDGVALLVEPLNNPQRESLPRQEDSIEQL